MEWKLLEPKYTKKYSVDTFEKELHETGNSPDIRREDSKVRIKENR